MQQDVFLGLPADIEKIRPNRMPLAVHPMASCARAPKNVASVTRVSRERQHFFGRLKRLHAIPGSDL